MRKAGLRHGAEAADRCGRFFRASILIDINMNTALDDLRRFQGRLLSLIIAFRLFAYDAQHFSGFGKGHASIKRSISSASSRVGIWYSYSQSA